MPCNCDHLEANSLEIEISKVACLLDELRGKKQNKNSWVGYYPDVYNKITREFGDELTSKLCSKLQKIDVSKYSLEMQMWWRDHQEADKERIEKQIKKLKDDAVKKAALNKLTDYEKKLLGFG